MECLSVILTILIDILGATMHKQKIVRESLEDYDSMCIHACLRNQEVRTHL